MSKNKYAGRYNEKLYREIFDAIFKVKGNTFKVNHIARITGYSGNKLARYMPNLIEAGCIDIVHYRIHYYNNRTKIQRERTRYRKLITPDDIEDKLAEMARIQEEKDRGVYYGR